MRVATYNIHAGVGTDGRHDIERICTVIEEIGADVLALQEVELHDAEHGAIALLSQRYYEIGSSPVFTKRGHPYGNLLLSRFPISHIRHLSLCVMGCEPRGAVDVDLDAPGGLRVIATHLGLSPGERRDQVRRLLRACKEPQVSAGLTVLLGDLNEWLMWGRPLRWLHRHFGETPGYRTFPTFYPLLALDRIWVAPRSALIASWVHSTRTARRASDHLPLVADLLLPDLTTDAAPEAAGRSSRPPSRLR
ncbi:endonuclease/exonuclease/phosphatase family protein [Tahibacter amnicola]|uniref:Endonuclease/exonuclease/phosphatase family protein n=1 Tax=Tahibacter amnicola TaxID=2976241 RepID=A0ABY6B9U5_9GAMM|nr:endonuclease/exonuclease/phosphatase family protein [Tahibacter amnicola]UXI66557.1 endonuclease/exonuclease/phosphatase family protein [Tahibacter amnicola]